MKKLVSMLLALMLCLCGLTSAMAETATETTVEVFPYTVEDYKTWFDTFSSSMFEVTPAWVTAEDGKSIAVTVAGYGDVKVELNDQGQITCFSSNLIATEDTVETTSNAFGQLVALIALSSKATEDLSFLLSEENLQQFEIDLMSLLYNMIGRITEALEGPLTVSGEVSGNLCTFSMLLDVNTMTINFGFMFQP